MEEKPRWYITGSPPPPKGFIQGLKRAFKKDKKKLSPVYSGPII